MTIKYFTFNTTGAGVQWAVTANNGLYVAQDVTVGSTDNFAITGTGDTLSIDIDGILYGDQGGMSLTTATNAIVKIGDQAQIGGDLSDATGINLTDFEGSLENHGLVTGSVGIDMSGNVDLQSVNYGTITGTDSAIHLEAGSTGSFSLFNLGTIDAPSVGNSFGSLILSEGKTNDTIFNAGAINGTVALGGGDDIFFGTGSKAMSGAVGKLFSLLTGDASTKIGVFVDGGAGKDQILGSKFTDFLSGGKGNDLILGNNGDDLMFGGGGRDTIVGGKGEDEFVFQAASDSRGKAIDTITDFSHQQHDILSLGSIDAKPGTAADDAFKFIGTNNFSGKPGELRYEIHKNETIVLGNLDNDKQPEFEVHLSGKIHLQHGDFDL